MLYLCVFVLINRPVRSINSVTETRHIHSWMTLQIKLFYSKDTVLTVGVTFLSWIFAVSGTPTFFPFLFDYREGRTILI